MGAGTYSPDGQWMWDGASWIPAPPTGAPEPTPPSQPPPAAIIQPEPAPTPVVDSGLVEAPDDILNRCVVYVEEDETTFSVKFNWPSSAHPALKAAFNAMSGNTREGRFPTDYVDLSTFGSSTQAHLWKLWNEAKGHWSQFVRDEASRATTQAAATDNSELIGEGIGNLVIAGIVAAVYFFWFLPEIMSKAVEIRECRDSLSYQLGQRSCPNPDFLIAQAELFSYIFLGVGGFFLLVGLWKLASIFDD